MSFFEAKAPAVMAGLIRDLALTDVQAAGIVGNLGQESGLRAIQEYRPYAGRGGFGWPQWTGSRRVAFERWCRAHRLAEASDAANYGYLLVELRGPYANVVRELRLCRTVAEATQAFETHYEFAGVVAMARRARFAQEALSLYRADPLMPPMEAPMTAEPTAQAAGVNPTTAFVNAFVSRFVDWAWPELVANVPAPIRPFVDMIGKDRVVAFLETEAGSIVNLVLSQVYGTSAVSAPGAAAPADLSGVLGLVGSLFHHSAPAPEAHPAA